MADIVRKMKEDNLSDKEIMERLGMEEEELERLLDNSGMTIRGTKEIDGFGNRWVPTKIGSYIEYSKVNSSSFSICLFENNNQ